MSLYDFHIAVELVKQDSPFYALIMAAMMKADTPNTAKFKAAWPEVWAELDARYHARGGRLPDEMKGPEHEFIIFDEPPKEGESHGRTD